MQLSLPLPVYSTPDPAGPTASNARASADSSAKDATSPNGDSFESMLKNDAPADDAENGDTGPDAKTAAEMAAALLWMPMMAPTPTPAPLGLPENSAAVSAEPLAEVEIETTDGTGGVASQSVRAFAPGLTPLALGSEPAYAATTPDTGVMAPRPMGRAEKSNREKLVNVSAVAAPANEAIANREGGEAKLSGDSSMLADLAKPPAIPTVANPAAAGSALEFNQSAAAGLADVSKFTAKRVAVVSRVPGAVAAASPATPTAAPVAAPEISPNTVVPAEDLTSSVEKVTGADKSVAQEKNAALPLVPELNEKNSIKSEGKTFLEAGRKLVTAVGARVGTSVAKLGVTMSAAASTQSKPVAISDPAMPFVFSGETAATGTLTAEAPSPVSTVRETIATILSTVDALERRADVQQKSVDLNLNVGQEKLGLRVELRDGEVHTTFRTESAVMNSALAHEWRHIVQPTGERALRIAEPVFTSAVPPSSGSEFGSLGQGAPQNREQRTPATFVSALKREFYDSGSTESPAKDSPTVTSSQLLNVLA